MKYFRGNTGWVTADRASSGVLPIAYNDTHGVDNYFSISDARELAHDLLAACEYAEGQPHVETRVLTWEKAEKLRGEDPNKWDIYARKRGTTELCEYVGVMAHSGDHVLATRPSGGQERLFHVCDEKFTQEWEGVLRAKKGTHS